VPPEEVQELREDVLAMMDKGAPYREIVEQAVEAGWNSDFVTWYVSMMELHAGRMKIYDPKSFKDLPTLMPAVFLLSSLLTVGYLTRTITGLAVLGTIIVGFSWTGAKVWRVMTR
jgi:hypothetical protein